MLRLFFVRLLCVTANSDSSREEDRPRFARMHAAVFSPSISGGPLLVVVLATTIGACTAQLSEKSVDSRTSHENGRQSHHHHEGLHHTYRMTLMFSSLSGATSRSVSSMFAKSDSSRWM